ncbi:MAG: hypothetical protein ACOC41_00330 [Chitinivibrionales bacterium]
MRNTGENSHIIWISWERQRRSILLAQRLGAQLFIINDSRYGILRHPLSAIKTLIILARKRPATLIVQNPSMFLAMIASLAKAIFDYTLIVDRHSNFMLDAPDRRSFRYRLFMAMSKFSSRAADLTIVTNRQIARRIQQAGGAPFILPDPFVRHNKNGREKPVHDVFRIIFPSTWARDEPVMETARACEILGKDFIVYVTGSPRQNVLDAIGSPPNNFICTGFIPDQRYFELMGSCQVVMPLTRFPEVLVCGGYEAMSLGKPLVLGDSIALREFYPRGALFTDCTPDDIARKLITARSRYAVLKRQVKTLYRDRLKQWNRQFASLQDTMATL